MVIVLEQEGLAQGPAVPSAKSAAISPPASWGRDCTSFAGCPSRISRCFWCVWARGCFESHVSPDPLSGCKMTREKLWREFFADPSKWWWDHRVEKVNVRYPDFKRKMTQQSLWLIDKLTPTWVDSVLAAMPPGFLQSHISLWNVRLSKHVKAGDDMMALNLFQQMQRENMILDKFTFVWVLSSCSNLGSLEEGRRVHEQIILRGCESDVYVATCLVNMYAKCGSIEDAWTVFNKMDVHNLVSWSCMIAGYMRSGQGLKAMELFRLMQEEWVEPDAVTFVGVLNACAGVGALEEGRRVHELIIQRGCDSNVYVATCLVDMYAKCGSIEDACNVFNMMRERNVVSWNAIIRVYAKSGQGLKAMELFRQMQQERVEPDAITFVRVLDACASLAALAEGRRLHAQIIQRGYESIVYVATCLVDMYAKCGSIEDAWSVFTKMRERDVVAWNAMIGGFAMHGRSKRAIGLFKRMVKECLEINEITFTCLLSACSHGGLVKEGLRYFNSMTSRYNVLPTMEHYACMVDLLGRAGRLEEAVELTKRVSLESNRSLWMSLLGACRIHGNVEMAEMAAKRCSELDPENASNHLLRLNRRAAAGECHMCTAPDKERSEREAWKQTDCTLIEVNNVVHSFTVNENHPQLLEIYAELERLTERMNEAGYVPDARFM